MNRRLTYLAAALLLPVLLLVIAADYGWRLPTAVLDVKSYGAQGDGATDDVAAIDKAQLAVNAAGGGVLPFPRGSYAIGGNNGLILKASRITYKGAGIDATTLLKSSSSGPLFQSSGSFPAQQITFEDMTFDWNGSVAASSMGNLTGTHVTDITFRRCRFVGNGLTATSLVGMKVIDCKFEQPGVPTVTGINLTRNYKNIEVRGTKFRYLRNGIISDTGSLTYGQTEDVSEFLTIKDNYFEGGWNMLRTSAANSGGTVTYTGTVLTDTAAAFSGVTQFDCIRIMTTRRTNSGATVSYGNLTVTDSAATFLTDGVKVGEIVRAGAAFGIVANVKSETELQVEEWLDDTTRYPTATPAAATAYTAYGLVLGQATSATATTITVPRWFDLLGNTVTPSAGTRYELCVKHGDYAGLNLEASTRNILIDGNTFRRARADQISVFGYRATITNNTIVDGQDEGITLHGQHNIVANNRMRHQGTSAIYHGGDDSIFTNNQMIDCQWTNIDTTEIGGMTLNGNRNYVSGNHIERVAVALGYHGLVIGNDSSSDSNVIGRNIFRGHLTDDIYIWPTDGTNTDISANRGIVVTDSGTGTIQGNKVSFASATAVTVNANTTAEQSLGTWTPAIAAAFNLANRNVHFAASGIQTVNNSANSTFRVKLGGVTIAQYGTNTMTATLSNLRWRIEGYFTTATTGASGTVMCHSVLTAIVTSGAVTTTTYFDSNTATLGPIDLTGVTPLALTVAYSANGATPNSCTQQILSGEVIN